ncbi:MAG TPA: glycosyltransferase [Gemmataceae bacterium]|jgi:glycosyltransferase involved in cell wall biosynthesis|nr:glycosyltransferase [Gemmataceae bacterium]
MRALHVIPAVAPRYGGPSASLLPMCAALALRPGLRVEVATTDADGSAGRLTAADLPAGDVPVHLFRRDWSERWKYSRGLAAWLRRHAGDYDVLHVHAVWGHATAAACRAARRAGVPVLLRPCGMLSDYSRRRSAWRKALYWRLVERPNLAAVRLFHATSAAEGRELEGLGLGVPAEVIPLGVDPQAWSQPRDPGALRERCGAAAGGRPVLLFLSRLHPKKGLADLLLPAMARLRGDAFLAVAGGPDEHEPRYADAVRAEVERLGLAGRVALLGAVAPAQRWALLDGAAAFVLPSRSENFGVVVAEAMARGVPVVVSDSVQSCEHVAVADSGRVVPLQVEALADALDGLLAAPELRQEMGRRGQDYARRHFAWPAIAECIAAAYTSCLG